MYLALFLTPWMLGYALSTIVINHNASGPQTFITESQQPYSAVFPPGTPARQIGEQILSDLHLEGAFGVQEPRPDGTLVVNRQDLLHPRRITYSPADHHLVVDDAVVRLTRSAPFAADRAMAWSIDAVIVALVFWALSGLWMWWEMRATRLWGFAAALFGIGMFAFLALTI